MSTPAKTPWRIVGEHRASDHCTWGCAQRPGEGGVYQPPALRHSTAWEEGVT
jgi:hypothetical protein